MYTIDAKIIGTSALMQHRFPMPLDALTPKGGKVQTGAKDYSQEWREYLYADAQGMIYQPAVHIEGALFKAAVDFKITGRRGKTYKDLFKAALMVTPDRISHHVAVPEELDTDADKPLYLDVRPVVVQRARVVRIRPCFKEGWTLDFQIEVIDDELPQGVVQDALTMAGRAVGIGDFRPRFGRFTVARFEVLKAS